MQCINKKSQNTIQKIKNIAVLGAESDIGRSIISLFLESEFLKVSAFSHTMHKSLLCEDIDVPVLDMRGFDCKNFNIILCCDKIYFPYVEAQKGANCVINVSSDFACEHIDGVITIPHYSVIVLKQVLSVLHDMHCLSDISITSLNAVSCFGHAAMQDLILQTKAMFMNNTVPKGFFPFQIAYNILPSHGEITDSSGTVFEKYVANEMKKLFGCNTSLYSMVVPVFIGNIMIVSAICKKIPNIKKYVKKLQVNKDIVVYANTDGPMREVTPCSMVGSFLIYIHRLRQIGNKIEMMVNFDHIKITAWEAHRIVERL